MKVVFKTNLGATDAKALNLDHKKCTAGATLDVDKEVGEKLVATGVAVTTDDAKDDPIIQSAQGVPEVPSEETLRGLAKPAGVKGVSPPGSVERATEDLENFKRTGTTKQ